MPAAMVVLLGRHLPALLGLFKKKGEWVWLPGERRDPEQKPPGVEKNRDGGWEAVMGWGRGPLLRPESPGLPLSIQLLCCGFVWVQFVTGRREPGVLTWRLCRPPAGVLSFS